MDINYSGGMHKNKLHHFTIPISVMFCCGYVDSLNRECLCLILFLTDYCVHVIVSPCHGCSELSVGLIVYQFWGIVLRRQNAHYLSGKERVFIFNQYSKF